MIRRDAPKQPDRAYLKLPRIDSQVKATIELDGIHFAGLQCVLQLGDLFFELVRYGRAVRPVEVDPGSPFLQFLRPGERRQRNGHVRQGTFL